MWTKWLLQKRTNTCSHFAVIESLQRQRVIRKNFLTSDDVTGWACSRNDRLLTVLSHKRVTSQTTHVWRKRRLF